MLPPKYLSSLTQVGYLEFYSIGIQGPETRQDHDVAWTSWHRYRPPQAPDAIRANINRPNMGLGDAVT